MNTNNEIVKISKLQVQLCKRNKGTQTKSKSKKTRMNNIKKKTINPNN